MSDADALVNLFKQRLVLGEVQYGLFCGLADTVATEVLAGAGFDWLMLDTEHAPNDLRSVLHQLQAAAPYADSTSIVVRPAVGDPVLIKRLLDVGAQTLLVPMVESAEHAADLVAAVRYPPAGIRGVGTSLARAARWNRVPGYAQRADDVVCLVCQIESVIGVEQLEAIAAVDGVDALFVGPSDLAASMGHIGNPGHPDVQAAVDKAISAIVGAGKPAGVFAVAPDSAKRWIDLGASFVAIGVDVSLLARSATDLVGAFRAAR